MLVIAYAIAKHNSLETGHDEMTLNLFNVNAIMSEKNNTHNFDKQKKG